MSSQTPMPDYEKLQAALSGAGIDSGSAEIHGLLCGIVSRGGANTTDWSGVLAAAGMALDSVPEALRTTLAGLMAASAGSLADGQMHFSLLLPDPETGIRVRADGIASWCQGYVMGLALGGSSGMEGLSPEAREAVADLIRISGAMADRDGDAETQDRALSEIEEFVRVAVQLIYEDFRSRDGEKGANGPGPV
jgi:uncharacterized protein YgfB (UPF0149 family)